MQNHWLRELHRLAWLLAASAALGLASGYSLLFLSLGLALYSGWMLWQLRRIHDWLKADQAGEPPHGHGIWGYVFDRIYRLQKDQQSIREKLEADVEYLHASFTSLSDAVVMINRHGMIDWCNPAAVRFLGLRLPVDLRQPIVNLLRDPRFVDYFEQGHFADPVIISAPIDQERTLSVHITRFGQGNYLLFARDISEILRLEQMRKDFVSNVSHELRTPLTVLAGYIDNFSLFADRNPAMKKPLEQMAQNARRMENLLRDLLELSRLETLSNETHKSQVNLQQLLAMIAEDARASLVAGESRTISVDCDGPVNILGHATELHSALSNLVVNACKYTHDGSRIDVRCWQDDKGVHVAVIDDGIGIDPLEIPRLTERFYRSDRSRSINTGGTGLGLAIVKRILQRHEAELEITSALGKGSSFICHFPLHRAVGTGAIQQLVQQ